MESLDSTLFFWLNASEHPGALALTLALFFAEQLIRAVPLLIGIGWLRGSEAARKTMLSRRVDRARMGTRVSLWPA